MSICLAIVAFQPANGQESNAPISTASPAATAVAGPIQAQPAPEQALRDPFWPVGYLPQKSVEPPPVTPPVVPDNSGTGTVANVVIPAQTNQNVVAVIPQDTAIHWPELKVKGLSKQPDGSYLAIIEGIKNIVEAGQNIQMSRDGMIFRWKINEINKKGIIQQKLECKPDRDYKPASDRNAKTL